MKSYKGLGMNDEHNSCSSEQLVLNRRKVSSKLNCRCRDNADAAFNLYGIGISPNSNNLCGDHFRDWTLTLQDSCSLVLKLI